MLDPQTQPLPPAGPVMPPAWSCERFDAVDVVRLEIGGELDVRTAPKLGHAVGRAQADAALVVVDLRRVTFIDSSGGQALIVAHRAAKASGGRLAVVRGPARVERLFRLIGAEDELWFVDHPSQAGAQEGPFQPWAEWFAPEPVLDPARVLELEQRIRTAHDAGRHRIVLDLAALETPGTHTLSRLSAALRRLSRAGMVITVVGAEPRVRWVLEVCAMDGVRFDLAAARRPS